VEREIADKKVSPKVRKLVTEFEESLEEYVYKPVRPAEVLTISDVNLFRECLAIDNQNAIDTLLRWLNFTTRQVIDALRTIYGQEPEKIDYPEFTPNLIANFIVPNPVVPIEVRYPDIWPDTIFDVWVNNGALMPIDVGRYIQSIRTKKDVPIHKLAELSNLAPATLVKIEQGQIARITLDDALKLDEALSSEGVIFSMLWDAEVFINFYGVVRRDNWLDFHYYKDRETILLQMFVMISRWMYYTPGRDVDWLNKFRSELKFEI
jgi:transcriptional regulator with XRE-family HTH domain